MLAPPGLATSSALPPLYRHLDDAALHAPGLESPWVCLGNFDGVHRGHQHLLNHMQQRAHAQGCPSLIITFFPTAKMVFQQQPCLSTAAEKHQQLAHFAPSAVVMLPFSKAFARTDPAHFVAQLESLAPAGIVVGEDFRFGHQRAGGLTELASITPRLEPIAMQQLDGEPIKSSHIRSLLQHAKLSEAAQLLGYPYSCRGVVVEGDKRGRTIGYPTANLRCAPHKLLPPGVFAVHCTVAGTQYQGMANVGARPSIRHSTSPMPSIEVHLFDADIDIYGATMVVTFHAFLRTQRAFDGLEALRAQLDADAAQARALLTTSL